MLEQANTSKIILYQLPNSHLLIQSQQQPLEKDVKYVQS